MKLLSVFIAIFAVTATFAQKPPASGQKSTAQAQKDTKQVSDAKLKQLEAAYSASKLAFTKKPKDAKAKKSYVDATFAVGMGRMYSESLPPRVKYVKALEAFREVLKTDPKHKGAQENQDMIVKIYKQMGRPVPGGN